MPDLPSRIPAPTFTPDAYDETRALGRRRRRRQVAWAGGGSGAVAAVVAVVVLAQSSAPGGRALLIPSDASPTTEASTVAVQQEPPTTAPSALSALPTPSLPPLPLVAGTSSPAPKPSPSPSPVASTASEPGTPTTGPRPTVTTYDVSRRCDGSGPTATSGWCSYYDGDLTAARGTTAELAGAVCRMTGRGTGTLKADDGEYASFYAATRDAGVLWEWRHGRTFTPDANSWDVAEGTCLRFAVTWDLRGNNGLPLPPGSYDADARPYVFDTGAVTTRTDSGITFTIT